MTASASSPGSGFAPTNTPVSPSRKVSGIPPTAGATTGMPRACASMATFGVPSNIEVSSTTSIIPSQGTTSSVAGRRRKRESSPQSAIRRCIAPASGPCPRTTKKRSGWRRTNASAVSIHNSGRFSWLGRNSEPTIRQSGGIPCACFQAVALAESCCAPTPPTSMALYTVRTESAGSLSQVS